ncbi:MAG: adenylate/guanylate cyclase domain-containing protein [Pseudomonadota bacterium]
MSGGLGRLAEKIEQRVADTAHSEEDKLKRKLLLFASAMMCFGIMFWLAIYWLMGLQFSATVPLLFQLICLMSIAWFLRSGSFERFRAIQLSLFLFVPFVMQWSIGNYVASSGVALWALVAPLGAVVFHGWRQSLPWFAAYVVFTALSGYFDFYLMHDQVGGVPVQTVALFFGMNFAAISTIVYLLVRYFVREQEKIKELLANEQALLAEKSELLLLERDKSERLLLNVLPARIARRLKDDQRSIADGHADVSVMFADLVNFTRLTEQMAPAEMVDLLNRVFSNYDYLADKYRVEKIKTVGDAYMVAGGLTGREVDYVAAIADMALEMRDLMGQHPLLRQHHFGVHIGIATGPVVAGVLGSKRLVYDLWGDTVNVASRLSTEGAPGDIQVDKATYHRLETRYDFSGPHHIELKGKGELAMYHLLHKKSDGGR